MRRLHKDDVPVPVPGQCDFHSGCLLERILVRIPLRAVVLIFVYWLGPKISTVSHLDPLFGPEYMNNLSPFPNSYISVHIIDERNVVAATQPMDSIPGSFINIKLVRHPQVLSNFNEEDLLRESCPASAIPSNHGLVRVHGTVRSKLLLSSHKYLVCRSIPSQI